MCIPSEAASSVEEDDLPRIEEDRSSVKGLIPLPSPVTGALACLPVLCIVVGARAASRPPSTELVRGETEVPEPEPLQQEQVAFGSGDTLELICSLPGGASTGCTVWSKDGTRLAASHRILLGPQRLRMLNASSEDAGVYICH
ncbi:fibroblast growth factor receptor 3-like [Peromyscus eremicus]|uniref:fibroblast growth factor receptor 3-like n=1 Tax=Peromyscus eremicus TaxID=42410 RepID=UPI0027DD2968|nr:fibroblast growth factor receptor 3-like [Peromyscus eremicus]